MSGSQDILRGEPGTDRSRDPVALARNLGFRPHELNRLERLVQENRKDFLEAWNEHIGA